MNLLPLECAVIIKHKNQRASCRLKRVWAFVVRRRKGAAPPADDAMVGVWHMRWVAQVLHTRTLSALQLSQVSIGEGNRHLKQPRL